MAPFKRQVYKLPSHIELPITVSQVSTQKTAAKSSFNMKFAVVLVAVVAAAFIEGVLSQMPQAQEINAEELMRILAGPQNDAEFLERCKKSPEFAATNNAAAQNPQNPKADFGSVSVGSAQDFKAEYNPSPKSYGYESASPSLSYHAPGPHIPCSKAVILSCAPSIQAAPCSAPSYSASAY